MSLAPKLARLIVAVVLASLCLVSFLKLLYLPVSGYAIAQCMLYMAAMFALQLFYFGRSTGRLRSPLGYAALGLQACLAYLPMLQFKQAWVSMPGFLAGSVLLVLPSPLGWAAFALVVLSMAGVQHLLSGYPIDIVYTALSTMITGLVVYGLTRLANLVTEVHATRAELARMAVADERLRFARDLHDLLGYSLSAVTLKSELTSRLVARQPDRAQQELAEILRISRQALADVRAVASGYRELSLDDEARSAGSVLAAADVDVRMVLEYDDLPARVSTVLATVLREGITNVLRHSNAESVEIAIRQRDGRVELDIANDGVAPRRRRPPNRDSSGIQSLAQRVADLGGKLRAAPGAGGRYRLHAAIPLATEPADG